MDNQHRKIKGYRELSQVEIDLMNRIKEKGLELAELITDIRAHHTAQRLQAEQWATGAEIDRINEAEPERWCALGRTKLQEGLMDLTRSVAQPGFF